MRELEIRPGQIGELLLLVRVYSILRGAGRARAARELDVVVVIMVDIAHNIFNFSHPIPRQNPPVPEPPDPPTAA